MDVRSVDVAGSSVCVRTWGRPNGIPFVFWHSLGFAGNGAFLDVAAPPLVEAGFAPIALDAPGYGGSAALDREEYAVDRLADLLWNLVDALELRRPIVLSGHSWGGTIALTAAAQRPEDVRALVLFDSGHIDYADWPGARPEATVEELLAELEADPPPTTWDDLVILLAEHGLDQEWTLAAWQEGFDVAADGGLQLRASNEVLAASRMGLMRARASDAWPTVAAARDPDPAPARHRARGAARAERGGGRTDAGDRAGGGDPAGSGDAPRRFADLGAGVGATVAEWSSARGLSA